MERDLGAWSSCCGNSVPLPGPQGEDSASFAAFLLPSLVQSPGQIAAIEQAPRKGKARCPDLAKREQKEIWGKCSNPPPIRPCFHLSFIISAPNPDFVNHGALCKRDCT